MAARFDASTDVLSRTASGLGSTAVTMCGWVYIDVDRNAYSTFMGADDGAANWAILTFGPDGTTLEASTTSGFAVGDSFTVGQWYFAAMVYDPSGVDTVYWAAPGAVLSSATGTAFSGFNDAWTFRVGQDGFGDRLDGRVANARVWTAVLNATEIAAERAAMTSAARTTGLWADWPLTSDPNDISGNGRNLTAGGTVTYVSGPPVALTVANSAQAQASETPTLTPWSALAVANSTQAQASASPGLTQHQVLTVAGSAQTQASQNVTLPVDGAFPVAVSANSRHLVDQHGAPWLCVGDTAWGIIGSLTDAEIEAYLDNRAAKGVNLTLFSSPEAFYAPLAPNNVDNVAPFTGTAFQSTLNNTYWDRLDLLVSLAEARGITVLVCPFYLGFVGGSDGWAAAVAAASNAQMATYAGYLHTRYGTAQNVMWLIGHDKIPTATEVARADAFLDQFVTLGNTQLWTFGGWHPRDVGGTDTWGFGSEDWSASSHTPDFDTQYDYSEHISVNAYTMWANSPMLPFVFFEGKYEQEQSIGIGNVLLREQMWAGFFAGAFGSIFGNNPIWNFENNPIFGFTGTWEANMDFAGSEHLAAFATIAATLAWPDTNADTGSTFCTTQGTGTSRVAARFGADGGLVYHPAFTSGSITLDLTEFAGNWSTVVVTRIDPVSGAVTSVDASEATTNSAFAIAAPGANSVGDNDWLFVVEGLTAVLTVAGSGQAQASQSPSLTQHHVLAVDDSGQAQASASPALTQHHVLAVADSAQAQTSATPALTQHQAIVVAVSGQAQASGHVSLGAVLEIDDTTQAQSSTTPALVQHQVLVVQSSAQGQASESPSLSAEHETILVDNSTQAQTSTTPSLTQHQVLTVASSAQAQVSDVVPIGAGIRVVSIAGPVVSGPTATLAISGPTATLEVTRYET